MAAPCVLLAPVGVHSGGPTAAKSGLGWVNFVVPFVVEGNSLVRAWRLLDIRTGSNSVVVEELRAGAGLVKIISAL